MNSLVKFVLIAIAGAVGASWIGRQPWASALVDKVPGGSLVAVGAIGLFLPGMIGVRGSNRKLVEIASAGALIVGGYNYARPMIQERFGLSVYQPQMLVDTSYATHAKAGYYSTSRNLSTAGRKL